MKCSSLIPIVSTLLISANSMKLPSIFTKCDVSKSDSDQCLSQAISEGIRQLELPLPEYGIPSLEPCQLPEGTSVEFGDKNTCLEQSYSNINVSGLTRVESTKAKFDLVKKSLRLKITFGDLHYHFDYAIRGKLIFLPVDGSTQGEIIWVNPTFLIIFQLFEYQKEGQRYYRVSESNLEMYARKMIFNYGDVLKNDVLTKGLNAEMGAHWQEIFDANVPQYKGLYTQLFTGLFSNLLEKVPVSDLFDGISK